MPCSEAGTTTAPDTIDTTETGIDGALTFLAMDARRLGFLEMKTAGGMTVVSFDTILTEQEKRLIHGAH